MEEVFTKLFFRKPLAFNQTVLYGAYISAAAAVPLMLLRKHCYLEIEVPVQVDAE